MIASYCFLRFNIKLFYLFSHFLENFSIIAGHLFKQTMSKILVFWVSFFSKKFLICLTLKSCEFRKKMTWFPLNFLCGKESEARAEKKYFFRITDFCWNIFAKTSTIPPRNVTKGKFYENLKRLDKIIKSRFSLVFFECSF